MTSRRTKIVRWVTGRYMQKLDVPNVPVERARQHLETFAKMFLVVSKGVSAESGQLAGIDVDWLRPKGARADKILLYLHGGAYILGSRRTHRQLVSHMAREAGITAVLPEYRLAPEYPFPAGIDDAVAVYRALLESGYSPQDIVISGDSAGGGLSLALTLSLRDAGELLPAGVVCISPWTDLTMSSASHREKARAEMTLHPDNLRLWALCYAGEGDLQNPLISPYFAEYAGFYPSGTMPPLLIQVGGEEVLLDDARVVAEKAKAVGMDVTLSVYEGMWHVWHMMGTMLPEGRDAFDEIGRFVKGE